MLQSRTPIERRARGQLFSSLAFSLRLRTEHREPVLFLISFLCLVANGAHDARTASRYDSHQKLPGEVRSTYPSVMCEAAQDGQDFRRESSLPGWCFFFFKQKTAYEI